MVEGFKAVGIGLDEGGEDGFRFFIVLSMIEEQGTLGLEVVRGRERFEQFVD